MFPPLPFFSSLLFFSGHFELRIKPSYHHTIIPSSLCLSFPGPAECAKRLNNSSSRFRIKIKEYLKEEIKGLNLLNKKLDMQG